MSACRALFLCPVGIYGKTIFSGRHCDFAQGSMNFQKLDQSDCLKVNKKKKHFKNFTLVWFGGLVKKPLNFKESLTGGLSRLCVVGLVRFEIRFEIIKIRFGLEKIQSL